MADLTLKAAYATVTEDDGFRFVGFVEEDDEGYALFRQPLDGGAVWFEVNDEEFGDDEALAVVSLTVKGLEITLTPEAAPRFGWAGSVAIRLPATCENRDEAVAALTAMLGPLLQTG